MRSGAAGAVKALVLNVMTQDGETEGYTASDHVKAILHHAGPNVVDVCVANSRARAGGERSRRIRLEGAEPASGSTVRRSWRWAWRCGNSRCCSSGRYIRHNPDELAKAVLDVWKEFRIH